MLLIYSPDKRDQQNSALENPVQARRSDEELRRWPKDGVTSPARRSSGEAHQSGRGSRTESARKGPRPGDVKQCNFLTNCHTLGIVTSETHRLKERVFPYFDVNVNMSVSSLLEHFTVIVECFVRTVAVDTAVLSPLFCEKDLALSGRVGSQAKVRKSLTETSSAAADR